MFKHIMVPFDLAAKEKLAKAIKVAGDLARRHGSRLTLISVAGGINGMVSHSVEEYRRLLAAYAAQIEQAEGIDVDSKVYDVPDPSAEVDRTLMEAIDDTGADLIVMASHQPGWVEYLVSSHAGRVAAHAPVSVFVVRNQG
ncbi:universal stress protein [uncultured Roseovarius sp.]|uniref:universal stress protein n=1 Tax=uncultured Roseovarius sp. TaxID=293344 RepID=UPI00260C0031|nr:universal stress protein [uncultured Roseovarius sp.]